MGFFDSLGQAASKAMDSHLRSMSVADLKKLVQKGGPAAGKAAEELRRRGK